MTINRLLNDTPMGALAPGQHMDFPIKVLTRIIRLRHLANPQHSAFP
jgi:hypothetical protein